MAILSYSTQFIRGTWSLTKICLILVTLPALMLLQFIITRGQWGDDIPCHLPDIDPFDESIRAFIHPPDNFTCSTHDPLTYTSLEGGHHVLRIRQEVLHHYDTTPEHLRCAYSILTRKADSKNNESEFRTLKNEARLLSSEEFLYVKCCDDRAENITIYNNVHAVVQMKPSLNYVPLKNINGDIKKLRPNVLIFGIDAMSRLNFKRTMPKTESYILANGWIEQRKFHKVGENTYPNLMALLTGNSEEQLLPKKCWGMAAPTYHDHCPFVWKDFKSKGYTTMYAEDERDLSTFNWHSNLHGFIKQPTDYYMRPFVVTAEEKLQLVTRHNLFLCLGPTSTVDIFFKYTKELLETFRNSFFGFTWFNHFSHNLLTIPDSIDDTYKEYIEGLHKSGILNNTIVIFISDHGMRFGEIRESYVGWLEVRLPFLYIWLPDWFKKRYPVAHRNMLENGNRLTSMYDMHLTLQDLAGGSVGKHTSGCPGCQTCRSLFTPIPDERSCHDAGVPPEFCGCLQQRKVDTTGEVVPGATRFVLDYINEMASNYSECAVLTLKKIISARKKERGFFVSGNEDEYVISFETEPGLAHFEAAVKYRRRADPAYQIVGNMVFRINAYGNTSACVRHKKMLKMYCFCL